MEPIAHIITFCYIIGLITGAACLCVTVLSKEKISKLFGLEYLILKKFQVFFFFFFLANFLVYYNEVFMSIQHFKTIMLIVFDVLLVIFVYYGIKLNVLSSVELVLKLFLLVGVIYIVLWSITYIADFSERPVLRAILVLMADAIFSAVSSGILIVCTTHQLRHNEELWERRYLTALNIMLIVYICILYCYDLFTELSHAYVSANIMYPYFAEPVILVFFAVNGFSMAYLAVGVRHVRAKETEESMLPKEPEETTEALYKAHNISVREKEVIELIVKGRNNAEIAEELNISIYTVKRHINNIFRKLEVKSRFALLSKLKQNTP